jgi:hypothetical protein
MTEKSWWHKEHVGIYIGTIEPRFSFVPDPTCPARLLIFWKNIAMLLCIIWLNMHCLSVEKEKYLKASAHNFFKVNFCKKIYLARGYESKSSETKFEENIWRNKIRRKHLKKQNLKKTFKETKFEENIGQQCKNSSWQARRNLSTR